MLTPLGVKLKKIAEELRHRSGYVPVVGAEHCPKCWITHKTTYLRSEPYHNCDALSVVCDACGFYLVS